MAIFKGKIRNGNIISLLFIVITCTILVVLYVYTVRDIESIYKKNTQSMIENLKKSVLHDTVENQIRRIDLRRSQEIERCKIQVEQITKFFMIDDFSSTEEFVGHFVASLRTMQTFGQFESFLWDAETKQVYFDSADPANIGTIFDMSNIDTNDFATSQSLRNQRYMLFVGFRNAYVDDRVKSEIALQIHNSQFDEDSYLWVNEIINYHGGDNYAIRRIHPNLKDTEGMLHSTNMTDIVGNYPYLEELEGIKEHGSIYFSYYFKRKNSDEIAKKLTYARLYEPYNWVVAMGIHLEDMQKYVDTVNNESAQLVKSILIGFAIIIVVLIGVSFLIIMFIEKIKAHNIHKSIEQEVNLDTLTHAFSRRAGNKDFPKLFYLFVTKHRNSAFLMFDTDNFKRINDAFGHEVGDQVLVFMVQAIKTVMGPSDRLYRWGGDEFVLTRPNIECTEVHEFAESIRKVIENSNELFDIVGSFVHISIGYSCFKLTDNSYADVLKRSDVALYKAKTNGKNRVEAEY